MANNVFLTGRLTDEIKYTVDQKDPNKCIGRFTLAVKGYGDNTDFIPCVVFNKLAFTMHSYLHKGSKICLEGSISATSKKKDDGTWSNYFNVIVSSFEFLDPKKQEPDAKQEISAEDMELIAKMFSKQVKK